MKSSCSSETKSGVGTSFFMVVVRGIGYVLNMLG